MDRFDLLPSAVQQAAKDQGSDVNGVFHDGSLYLVRERMRSPLDVEWTVFYEATHKGIRDLYADANIVRASNRLYEAMGSPRRASGPAGAARSGQLRRCAGLK